MSLIFLWYFFQVSIRWRATLRHPLFWRVRPHLPCSFSMMAILQTHDNIGELQPIVENSIRSMSQQWRVICSLTIVAEWDVYSVFFTCASSPMQPEPGCLREIPQICFPTAQFAESSWVCRLLEVQMIVWYCLHCFIKDFSKDKIRDRWWVLNLL